MIATQQDTVHIETVQRVCCHRLRIEFSDGKIAEVDFEPFLRASSHPEIHRYLDKRRFQRYRLTHGVLNWGDFDLVFPMEDLYRGVIR